MPGFPTLTVPLSDDLVALRDFTERDIPDILIAYEDDPTLHQRIGQERPPSGAQLGRWAETESADRRVGAHATLTVTRPGRDLCCGQVNVHHADWEHRRVEVGVWLAPQARGQGLGRRALRLAAQWLLTEGGLARVQLITEADNTAMIAAAQAAGFTFEGVLRRYYRLGRRRDDCAILSLLADDLARPVAA
jgi:RimJ/RimL family protein N-acetyltransferase